MNTPDELMQKMVQYDDIESLIALYIEARKAKDEYDNLRKALQSKVEERLRQTGETKGRTSFGISYGITQPTPKTRLDKSAWEKAILEDEKLHKLVYDYEYKQKQIEAAQRQFTEEYIPEGRVYIK